MAPRGSPNYKRLGKVQPLIDHITRKFTELYNPNKELAVDEAIIIKFQGQSSLKQYMPLKPVKCGVKVWVLADSKNRYFSKLQVYMGKEDSSEKVLGSRVVKELTAHLHGKKHHVFFDNFFTKKELLEDLEKDGIYACETARKDRQGFLDLLKTAKLANRYKCMCVRVWEVHVYTGVNGYSCLLVYVH